MSRLSFTFKEEVMKKSPIQSCQQNLFELEPIKAPPKQQKTTQRSQDNFVFDLVDVLQAPVLTFSMSWADTIPQRLLDILPIARMIALKQNEQLATYAEVAIYIYTRTLEAPMDSEWVDIYTHVSCTTLQQYFNEDHWQEVMAPATLSDWLQSKLRDLRRHIYDKRREILKKQLKASKAGDAKASEDGINNDQASPPQSLFS